MGEEMPSKLFHELDSFKKAKIIRVGIAEFARYGYTNSSTNRIVKDCGISKGSLFQYFKNKEDFYFYILDGITSELTAALDSKTGELSNDFFLRVIDYSQLEFAWYIQNPDKYKIIISAFAKSDTDIYHKIVARYSLTGEGIYYRLMEGIDASVFCRDKQKAIDIMKWFLSGFNEDYLSKISPQKNADIEQLKRDYAASLTEYLEILKAGLLG